MSVEFNENDIPKKIDISKYGVQKIREILKNHIKDGKIDFIWGPELEEKEKKEE